MGEKAVNTVKWKQLVSLLEGLGFKQDGDEFKDVKNRRIHYRSYELNDVLMNGVFWPQLGHYGIAPESLETLL